MRIRCVKSVMLDPNQSSLYRVDIIRASMLSQV